MTKAFWKSVFNTPSQANLQGTQTEFYRAFAVIFIISFSTAQGWRS
jgi:hypothetical protein